MRLPFPDGRLLVIGGTLIEMETFTVVHQIRTYGFDVQFSPDGRYLVYADGICLACGADESRHIGSATVWAIPRGD